MTMPLMRLGRSGLVTSRLALGTMTFGARTDEAEARRIVAAAAEAGVNVIGTADNYAGGRSEEIVGRAIAGNRHAWVLATKVANPVGVGPNGQGLSRKWLLEEVPRSLKRLGTDFVDILYLHKEDPGTPLEETARALADLQRMGAVRYFGVSNFKSWRLARLCAICDAEGIDRPVVSQPVYHALNRTAEAEMLPACAALGLGVMVYSPLARGVLAGKYAPEAPPPAESRAAARDKRILETEYRPETLRAGQAVSAHARERGIDPVAFAIAFVLANAYVTGAIVGPRTLDQWRAYLGALDVAWSQADEAAVDGVVPPGSTAAPHYADPAYPIEGRPTNFASTRE